MIRKLSTGIATFAVLAASFAPLAFAYNVTIGNTGSGSVNVVNVTKTKSHYISQSNNTGILIGITSTANSGGNNTNGNSGGGATSISGVATSGVTAAIGGSSNTITSHGCGCAKTPDIISIYNTGSGSNNVVNYTKSNYVSKSQSNFTRIGLLLDSEANSGGNNTNGNSGGKTLSISGGNSSGVLVGIQGSTNSF